MKLYTEEQVDIMLSRARMQKQDDTYMFTNEYLLSQETPIELPSDEEIEERSESYCKFIFSTGMLHGASNHTRQGYIQSAKWMKEQILKQNK